MLPLVVAENDKILDDKIKLKRITSKKMTTDKEKSWLRQKLREYKVKFWYGGVEKRMDIIPVSIALNKQQKRVDGELQDFGRNVFLTNDFVQKGIEPLNKEKSYTKCSNFQF